MLSVEETRRLLGDETLTDEEASEIRDTFRILGEIIFEKWFSERKALAQISTPPIMKKEPNK